MSAFVILFRNAPLTGHDVLRGDTGDHGLGRVLQAAAACGLRYTLVRSGAVQ